MSLYFKILTTQQICEVLKANEVCVIGVAKDNQPYVMPAHYRFKKDGPSFIFFLKSLQTGKKIHFIKNNKNVCITVMGKENNNITATVVALGTAQIVNNNKSDCTKNTDEKELVTIKVVCYEVTGRYYLQKDDKHTSKYN